MITAASNEESENYNIEDNANIIGLARILINGRHPGILATVDEDGKPALRWMSTLACEHFPILYTLTAPDSRKVAQIAKHPDVNWMFFNTNKSLILNLIGKARVLADTTTLKKIWNEVQDKSHTYFLDRYARGPGFVVIETTVETIECTSPESSLRFAIEPLEIAKD